MKTSKAKSTLAFWFTFLKIRAAMFIGRPPIVIHQMGKVGSTSLIRGLNSISGLPPICQTHFLTPEGVAEAERTFAGWHAAIPHHLRVAKILSPHLLREKGKPLLWRIATIVRDPIARTLSDIYQNPEIVGEPEGGIPPAEKVIAYLRRYFERFDEDSDMVCRWFKREFMEAFQLPVYASPFPVGEKYQLFEKNRVRALVLRLEDFSTVLANGEVIGRWLGQPVEIQVSQANAATARESFTSYDRVRTSLKFPRKDLEKVYSSDFARHFYHDLREQFVEQWSE